MVLSKPNSKAKQGSNNWIEVTISEGKNREVRNVMEYLELAVNRLIRLSYGPFHLGNLPKGSVLEIKPQMLKQQIPGTDHLERLAKIMLAVGMIVLYVYITEFFTAWYSESPAERGQYWYRAFGEHAAFFWVMIACNVGAIQLLWFKTLRRNLAVLVFIGVAVNLGMWLERYNIVVLSLERDHLPSKWTAYAFTGWDYLLLAGSFGLFFTQFLLFCRVAPVVSIAEIKATLLRRGHREAHHG